MKLSKRFLGSGFSVAVLFASLQVCAAASIVVEDSFTDAGTGLVRQPDRVNTLGLTWVSGAQGQSNPNAAQPTVGNGKYQTGFNSWYYLDITDPAKFTRPTAITLSADLTVNNIGQNNFGAGVALGFYSAAPTTAQANFTGFILEGEYPVGKGTLSFWQNGARTNANTFTISSFDPTESYNLKYTVDTLTGNVNSIYLNGALIIFDKAGTTVYSSGAFTNENTHYAGIWGRSQSSIAQFGYVENFMIEGDFVVIPEPGSVAASFALITLLIGCALKRRK